MIRLQNWFWGIVLLCSSSIISAQHSIDGVIDVCYGECETYSLVDGGGGPYYWITTGSLQTSNSATSVEICWSGIGSNSITLVDFSADFLDQSHKQEVIVQAIPEPELIFPLFPNCTIKDSIDSNPTGENEQLPIECHTVCSGSIATYSTIREEGSVITWHVEGGTILSSSDEEITIHWNDSGSGSIEIIENVTSSCSAASFYCMEIFDPFTLDINASGGGADDITICLGQEVYFQSIADEQVTKFEWISSDGHLSSGSGTSMTFNNPGSFDITLIGSTECGCVDSTYYTVIVGSDPGPQISCTGTTCPDTEQTYYADSNCSSYNWTISGNGTLIDGGGSSDDYITVNWTSGPVGEVTLSTTGCDTPVCAQATTVQIPVIESGAPISGPTIVCKSGYSTYSVQYYNGTEYSWSITGNGSILSGTNTNEITVQWDEAPWSDDNSTIQVEYDNCYLECGGLSTINVDLLPDFALSFENQGCKDNTFYINAWEGWNSASVTIEVIYPDNTSQTYTNVSYVSETYTEIGTYTVIATDSQNQYCNDQVTGTFEIIARPPYPGNIDGPLTVCLNEFYNYTADLPPSGYYARWRIIDGSSTRTERSTSITVEWTSSGPNELELTYYNENIYCFGETNVFTIEAAQSSTISGSDIVCVDENSSYTLNTLNGPTPEWTIDPSTAGSILSNDDNTISVMWHTPGNHKIESNFCGTNITYDVEVNPLPEPIVMFPDKVCAGEQAMIDVISGTNTVEIFDHEDNSISTLNNTMVDPGVYKVVVTSNYGCEDIIPVQIDSFSLPSIRVSSPQENAFCNPHPGIEIYALNTDDGYTYEWFHLGVSMGLTTPKITTTAYGGYHVIVTDQNGCTAKSNTHRLWEWCEGDQPPGTCSGGGGGGPIDFDEIKISCNNSQFNITGGSYISTMFSWTFDDPDSGVNNTAEGLNPIHSFTNAGFFYVFAIGNLAGEESVEIIEVSAAPRFDYDIACAGTGVLFNNLSTFIPGYTISQYNWNFGDPASGALNSSNDKHPTHIYDTPGQYTVTLDILGNNGCVSAYSLEVDVKPGPFAEFVLPTSACNSEGLPFIAFESDNIINYDWDFDDPISGDANTSTSTTPLHTFSNNGSYNVSLTVTELGGCSQTIVKPISVTNSTLSGDISSDKTFPMCFGEYAELSAPAGGDQYFWSNGMTGQTINVVEPDLYTVTITEPSGCDYIPDPVNVVVNGILNNRITGTVYENSGDYIGTKYYDSLTICQGDIVDLSARYLFNATYDWTGGISTNSFVPRNSFYSLTPGRHSYTVAITDPTTGCEVESAPFVIIVNALPSYTAITSSSPTLCEGDIHTLSVTTPESNMRYFWSNGQEGLTTEVSSAGYYSVYAINSNGCRSEGQGIAVNRLPDANKVNIGCMTACFPDTICIPNINGASTYQWLKDGLPYANAFYKDLEANEVGDYQLVVENWVGCVDTSEILSIEAEPSDQSISGIVFIDDNNNGIWESGETLLTGVPVSIYQGNSLISTLNTDGAGYYLFDPITIINPIIKIDTTGLGLDINGGIFEGEVEFSTCIEDKEQDFPLIQTCVTSNVTMDRYVCSGETVTINNIILAANDTWDFMDASMDGCDSITHITVLAFEEPDVSLNVTSTCMNSNTGTLDINIIIDTGLEFAIDNTSSFTPDVTYNNLSAGPHTLWLYDSNGCYKSYDFDIEIEQAPLMSVLPENTCQGGNTGSISITPIDAGNYQYSLDGINFSPSNNFNDMAEGSYTVYVAEISSVCSHEYPVNIISNPSPLFDLITDNTCANGDNGTLNITPLGSGSYEYSIDGISYTSLSEINGLAQGDYNLIVLEDGACSHTYNFIIEENQVPVMDLTASNSCAGSNNGNISILPETSGNYEYSIDGINFSTDQNFDGLSEGNHTIFVLEDGECMHQFSATIFPEPEPLVTFDTQEACIGEYNGSISVLSTEIGLEYSIDGVSYSSETTLSDLQAGIHTIFIKGADDCIHPFEVEILEAEEMQVIFEDPEIDCSIQEITLSPEVINPFGDYSFLWSDGSTQESFTANESGKLSVDISDECSLVSYEWDLDIEEVTDDQPIYFPNIFSPNSDGQNDCFTPVLGPKTEIISYNLIIFDRWGNKYYETTDINDCWNGKYHNKDVRSGVFVYILEMEYTYCVEVEKVKKYGDVTVVH